MNRRLGPVSDEMLLALAVWLCSLPLVAWLVTPWLGWQTALIVSLALLIATLLACWGLCGWTMAPGARRDAGKRDH